MNQYIKKSIPIQAEEYHQGLEDGILDFSEAINHGLDIKAYISPLGYNKVPYIKTLEGLLFISKGDYIIIGIKGERYPCKKEIFLETYQPIS